MQDYDAIILGAGGAGLMAAATAGQAGARVVVIDHAEAAGKKILISGGGRCNFTNTGTVRSGSCPRIPISPSPR
jgi:predicted flavoprotein YhiN